jgi:hypothetical protein
MSTLRENLMRQFKAEWTNKGNTRPLFFVLEEALTLAEEAEIGAKRLKDSGRYSAQGLLEAVRSDFAKNAVPAVSRLKEKISAYKDATANKRAKISVPKPDIEDPYQAMLRQEARAIMRTMSIGDVIGVLASADNKEAMEAAFEVPGWMVNSAFDGKVRDLVERNYLEKQFPDLLAEVDVQEEAIAVAEAALTHGLNTVRRLTGFDGMDRPFEQWLDNPNENRERDAA